MTNLRKMLRVVFLGLCLLGIPGCSHAWKQPQSWGAVQTPSPASASEPIGSYDAGCIRAARELPGGAAWLLSHPERRRDFGDPTLVKFIEDLSHHVPSGSRLRVGDLGQPRGGPLNSSHASHQIGLDADIEYQLEPGIQPGAASPPSRWARSVLAADHMSFERGRWGRAQVDLLRAAAQDARVARIFVHPTVKVRLCRTLVEPLDWITKLRPWPGHDDHFHVRLHCPAGAPLCREQPEPPWGSGCFEAQVAQAKQVAAELAPPAPRGEPAPDAQARDRAVREYDLPSECRAVLEAK